MAAGSKMPPHSLEAEQAVLGAVLRDNEALPKALEVVRPSDFYNEAHRLIFGAMLELSEQGKPIDLVMLQGLLSNNGKLAAAGGVVYLSQLLDMTPTAGAVRHYSQIVRDKADIRGLRDAALELQDLAELGTISAEELQARAAALIDRAPGSGEAAGDGLQPWWESMPDVVRFLDDGVQGLSTGFFTLDSKLLGLRGLVLLGGAPKLGKSTLALNIALHVAREVEGAAVLYYDLENGRNIVTLRLLANLYGRTIEQLRERRRFEGEAWQADAEEKIPGLYLVTDPRKIRPELIRRHVQRLGAKKTLVVLDSLQKLPPLEKMRRDSIDRWLRELEQIKQDPSVTILLISELSRGENEANYRRPSLGSYKESGSAEYSADIALQITEARGNDGPRGQCVLTCVANRHGASGFIANYDRRDFKHWRWTEVPGGGGV